MSIAFNAVMIKPEIKPREWRLDAHELCRQHAMPGCIGLAEACLAHGYQLGVKDTNEVYRKVTDFMKAERETGGRPQ